jgi:[ribosomal protein S5]-alanine N-acetyltransferase
MSFRIETARLALRAWRAGDRPALERMAGDVEMMRYVTAGRLWRPDEIDGFLARQARYLTDHGCCIGPMTRLETGDIVGIAGIQPIDLPGEFELGWWVWKEHWGHGYASEIAQALLRYTETVMRLPRVVAVIDPLNAPSIRVAEKIGMCFERTMSARETVARRDDVEIALYVSYFRPE